MIPIDTDHVDPEAFDLDDMTDRPIPSYVTGIDRTYVRQRRRNGQEHTAIADALLRGHERDWAAQEANGIPVYKRRHVLVLRAAPGKRRRSERRGEFTRALVSVCGKSGTPRQRRTFDVTTEYDREVHGCFECGSMGPCRPEPT